MPGGINRNGKSLGGSVTGNSFVGKMGRYHNCSCDSCSTSIRCGKRGDITGSAGGQADAGVAVCPGIGSVSG